MDEARPRQKTRGKDEAEAETSRQGRGEAEADILRGKDEAAQNAASRRPSRRLEAPRGKVFANTGLTEDASGQYLVYHGKIISRMKSW